MFKLPHKPQFINQPYLKTGASSPPRGREGETTAVRLSGEGRGSRDGSAAQIHKPSTTSRPLRHFAPLHPPTPTASAYHSCGARISLRNAQYHFCNAKISLQRIALPRVAGRLRDTNKPQCSKYIKSNFPDVANKKRLAPFFYLFMSALSVLPRK